MKILVSLSILFWLSLSTAIGQINLIGCSPNHTTGQTEIVTWEASDSSSVSHYPTALQGYLLCSSVFDAWNSNYYITGVTATGQGLLSFNSVSTIQTFSNFTNFSNISEIDMSTGKIYTLTSDSSQYFSVNQYDIQTGTDSVIGVVHQPGMMGIVVDAISFDSNNGILYYIGSDNTGANFLFSMFVRNPVFSYTMTTMQTGPNETSFQCLNYDNDNNILFGLQRDYNPSGGSYPTKIVEINTTTGMTTSHGQLTGIIGHQVGSSAFDQQTGTFLLIGVDSAFQSRLIMFNTITNIFQTGYLPSGVSELVCDNHTYAQTAYGTNSVAELHPKQYRAFPNPASDHVTITVPSDRKECVIQLKELNGNLVKLYQGVQNSDCLDLHESKTGLYFLEIRDSQGITTLKLIKN